MPTLILSPRMTDDSISLWRAAGRLGWTVERLTSFRIPDGFQVEDEAVLYVEGLVAPIIAEALGFVLPEPPENWLPSLPLEYRRRAIALVTLGHARTLATPHFIKPPNDKSFEAAVYVGSELPDEFAPEMKVLVSEVVRWTVEFRCFVLDRTLQTFSVYLRNGELQREAGFVHTAVEESRLLEYLKGVLSDHRVVLPQAAVIDVGMIDGKGWAVVEQNAAWGSGLYGCDPEKVLTVLLHASYRA